MCQLNKKPTEYILLGGKNRVSRFYFGVRSIFFIKLSFAFGPCSGGSSISHALQWIQYVCFGYENAIKHKSNKL